MIRKMYQEAFQNIVGNYFVDAIKRKTLKYI